jgi:hypothetical protein
MSTNILKETVTKLLDMPGITSNGRAWLAKALHPSDNVPEAVGVPTQYGVPSAPVNYTTTYVASAPVGQVASATWDCLITMVHHPYMFGKVWSSGTGPSGPIYQAVPLVNSQLGGVNQDTNVQNWFINTDTYRGTYCGHTFSLTAPTLADQGTVACAQIPLIPGEFCYSSGATQLNRTALLYPDLYGDSSFNFNALQGITGAYVSEAREGAYMPHRMTSETFQDKSSGITYGTYTDTASVQNIYVPAPLISSICAASTVHPFWDDTRTGTITRIGGAAHAPCNNNVSICYFKGISSAATITITTRQGFEITCPDTSLFIPSVGKPPVYDPVALTAYFAISRELSPAFPASYNFLGTLWNVVKTVGQAILPRILPVIGSTLGQLAGVSQRGEQMPQPKQQMTEIIVDSAQRGLNAYSTTMYRGGGRQQQQPRQRQQQQRQPRQRGPGYQPQQPNPNSKRQQKKKRQQQQRQQPARRPGGRMIDEGNY